MRRPVLVTWSPCSEMAGSGCGWRQCFAPRPTLEAQRSGVSGPKPRALSAELRARASRSNSAEWLTSYLALDVTGEESLP
jgi:hypothetical protein